MNNINVRKSLKASEHGDLNFGPEEVEKALKFKREYYANPIRTPESMERLILYSATSLDYNNFLKHYAPERCDSPINSFLNKN